uniref:Uncharacterized protein n=1 Tax=Arundo donax TaxID=35708 RepID=A0A0A9ET47_ARUDO
MIFTLLSIVSVNFVFFKILSASQLYSPASISTLAIGSSSVPLLLP